MNNETIYMLNRFPLSITCTVYNIKHWTVHETTGIFVMLELKVSTCLHQSLCCVSTTPSRSSNLTNLNRSLFLSKDPGDKLVLKTFGWRYKNNL